MVCMFRIAKAQSYSHSGSVHYGDCKMQLAILCSQATFASRKTPVPVSQQRVWAVGELNREEKEWGRDWDQKGCVEAMKGAISVPAAPPIS